MASTVSEVLREHPRNIGTNAHSYSESSKQWARTYSAMKHLSAHPIDGTSDPFDGHFQPLDQDHSTRMTQPSNRPNDGRDYLLDKEMDGREWFNTEIINPVLSAFTAFPSVRQSSENGIEKVVDTVQSISFDQGGDRFPIAIGEFKRNLIHAPAWQEGNLRLERQKLLSQELRGYAVQYRCPLIFCFDIHHLLILRIRADTEIAMSSENTEVDSWIIPRENNTGISMRWAIYRLFVEGIRRCQGWHAPKVRIDGRVSFARQYYSGLSLWHPELPQEYRRQLDMSRGQYVWMHRGTAIVDNEGRIVCDTLPLWQTRPAAAYSI